MRVGVAEVSWHVECKSAQIAPSADCRFAHMSAAQEPRRWRMFVVGRSTYAIMSET